MFVACSGSIPPELGRLNYLQILELRDNALTGEYNICGFIVILENGLHKRSETTRGLEILSNFVFLWRSDNPILVHIHVVEFSKKWEGLSQRMGLDL